MKYRLKGTVDAALYDGSVTDEIMELLGNSEFSVSPLDQVMTITLSQRTIKLPVGWYLVKNDSQPAGDNLSSCSQVVFPTIFEVIP
jgi:hypothetical protein